MNKNGVPFSVWTILHRNWGWVRDTTLRLGTLLILVLGLMNVNSGLSVMTRKELQRAALP